MTTNKGSAAKAARTEYPRMTRGMQKRLLRFLGYFCIFSAVIVIRLFQIWVTNGSRYEKTVLDQQNYASTTIPYQRGDIVDRKGTVLATSLDTYNLILDCRVLNEYRELDAKKNVSLSAGQTPRNTVQTTAEAIETYFPDVTAQSVLEKLESQPDSSYIVLQREVDIDRMLAFEELAAAEETGNQIQGVWFEKKYNRLYPYGDLAASCIGFTTRSDNDIERGVVGLESAYNDELTGTSGRSYGYMGEENVLERTIIEPENGSRIVTTLDAYVCTVVHEEIEKWNEEFGGDEVNGSLNTAVLVMNPNTGEIYAMEDYPFFDPSNAGDLSGYISESRLAAAQEASGDSGKEDEIPDEDTAEETDEDITEETENETEEDAASAQSTETISQILNETWNNFAVSNTFEPGSTAKPFTVAAGLETGTLDGSETYYCDGGEYVSNYYIGCVNRSGHGMLTISGALENSCNDALMQMAFQIGAKDFAVYQHLFGFGQRTGIDLPGEALTSSLVFSEEELDRTASNLATSSFGQSFAVTMVQLASAYCSLINGGILYEPHLVSQIQDSDGNLQKSIGPVEQKRTVSRETCEMEKTYLRAVVDSGSGKNAAVEGYSMGGKTGTAEKGRRDLENYVVSFICHVPAEDPEVVIYTVIDQPNAEDQAHSSYAVDLTNRIAERILPYLNITMESY